jgi:hypothetical protein
MQLEHTDPSGSGIATRPRGEPRHEAAEGEFVVGTERRPDTVILSLSGELDLAASALLERELDAAEAARPMRLVVDLTGLEFID